MMEEAHLTADRLFDLLHYDPETGFFTWKSRTSNRIKVGDVAGSPTNTGHLSIKIDGRHYKAHRLAWFYVTGEWPREQIDHANCIKMDNRFINLRQATNAQNQRNTGARTNNKSGLKGIYKARNGKWRAHIGVDGKLKHLGYYNSPEEAHAAYRDAAQVLHGEFARTEWEHASNG